MAFNLPANALPAAYILPRSSPMDDHAQERRRYFPDRCSRSSGLRIVLGCLLFGFGVFTESTPTGFRSIASAAEPVQRAAKITAEQARFFESRIRPILASECFACHGAKKQEASLRLDSRAAMLTGSDTGPIVKLGKPQESLLISAIRHQDDVEMPPEKKLSDKQIEALSHWIRIGAPWPASPSSDAAQTIAQFVDEARRTHWALQPIRRPPIPSTNSPWAKTPLDQLVLKKLTAKHLTPSPSASRRVLIRRATFDLWGLPPTPEAISIFLADDHPDAYGRLIDRLLASPRYGHRWGRHWLDVARYADTRGYNFGRERRYPYAYTYRDYVIGAFNSDLPFDRFVLEQIAADRLDLGEDKRPLAALGFLTVGRRFIKSADTIDDQIDVVSRGLLGLTISCARCHDHKYDPIPTGDYYSLYGVFASIEEPKDLTIIGLPSSVTAHEAYKKKAAAMQAKFDTFIDAQHAALMDIARRHATDYLVRAASSMPENRLRKLPFLSLKENELQPRIVKAWRGYIDRRKSDDEIFGPWHRLMEIPDDQFAEKAQSLVATFKTDTKLKINPRVKELFTTNPPRSKLDVGRLYGQLFQQIYAKKDDKQLPPGTDILRRVIIGEGSPTTISRDALVGYLSVVNINIYRKHQSRIKRHTAQSPGAPPRAMMVVDKAHPFDPYVFIRGSQSRRGKKVPRQLPQILVGNDRKPFRKGSGRLELAKAIVSDDNPLTARVLVNRVWMHHFGQPLVDSPSDFGLRSSPPTHPQVLDLLAWDFRRRGWSIKRLHRQIMLSATYTQASTNRAECQSIDPENRLLWRMNRQRLEFEAQRDSLLAAAGNLDEQIAGRSVDIQRLPFSSRRTVYAFVDRQDLPGLFRVFDFASPDQTTAKRPQTTVPQQALFLMNSAFVAEQAKRLVERADVSVVNDPGQRVGLIYQILFGRPASDAEKTLAARYIATVQDKNVAWGRYVQALLMSNEFAFVD